MTDQAAQLVDATRPPLDPMFPQLVKEADTPEQKLIGFIAYGLYEEARREWASDFRDREGRYPAENELRAYERSWTASRLDRASFFGETQVVDFARVSRRSRVRYWVRSGLIPSRAKALVWSGVGRA